MSVEPLQGRRRPEGLVRIAFRLPVLAYRLGLGWMLGERLLLLRHRGRRTGRRRETVLEVVHRDPGGPEWVVIAAWGEEADWLANIRASPALEVVVGKHRFRPVQRFLGAGEASHVLRAYRDRNPRLLRLLTRVMGWVYDGSDEALDQIAASRPMVAFSPPASAAEDRQP